MIRAGSNIGLKKESENVTFADVTNVIDIDDESVLKMIGFETKKVNDRNRKVIFDDQS